LYTEARGPTPTGGKGGKMFLGNRSSEGIPCKSVHGGGVLARIAQKQDMTDGTKRTFGRKKNCGPLKKVKA